MQSVGDRWYKLYNLLAAIVAVILLSAVICLELIPGLAAHRPDSQVILYAVAILAIIQLLYTGIFWRRFGRQQSAAVAALSGKLQTNEQQSEVLVQSLTDGVLLITTEGVITLMNPAAALMTGWSVEDAAKTEAKLVVNLRNEDGSDLEDGENPLLSILKTKTASTTTLQLVNHEGKSLIVSIVMSPVLDASNGTLSGAVAVLRDISVSHLEEKQRAEFISTASHEMRTPVAAIEGYLALALNEKVSKIDPKARGYLEKAHESTQHLGKLFQDLLMSAKAEDGRLVSHPTVVEMGSYIEQLAESFRFAADKRGLLTDFVFGSGGPAPTEGSGRVVRPLYYVHVDQDRIREVVTNLFDNAVKYTPSGKVSVGLTGNKDVVQIYVKDTGPGIPAVDLPHLFQKFYRVDNSATRTIGGTGLGLFICRKIVELYKGRIWVESTVGQGSTFYINLPRLDAQRATELQTKEAQNTDSAPVTSLTTPV